MLQRRPLQRLQRPSADPRAPAAALQHCDLIARASVRRRGFVCSLQCIHITSIHHHHVIAAITRNAPAQAAPAALPPRPAQCRATMIAPWPLTAPGTERAAGSLTLMALHRARWIGSCSSGRRMSIRAEEISLAARTGCWRRTSSSWSIAQLTFLSHVGLGIRACHPGCGFRWPPPSPAETAVWGELVILLGTPLEGRGPSEGGGRLHLDPLQRRCAQGRARGEQYSNARIRPPTQRRRGSRPEKASGDACHW